ncbi:HSF2, partial [Symbiodinium sp. KB8]
RCGRVLRGGDADASPDTSYDADAGAPFSPAWVNNTYLSGVRCKVAVWEVAHERVVDLSGTQAAPGKEKAGAAAQNTAVPPCVQCTAVGSVAEALQVLGAGVARRHTAATRCNATSSRSHLCIALVLQGVSLPGADGTTPPVHDGLVLFCDLAGAERALQAGTARDSKRLAEAGAVSKGLTALGKVLHGMASASSALRSGGRRVLPFRDSALTRCLRPVLGMPGTRVVMLATVAQARSARGGGVVSDTGALCRCSVVYRPHLHPFHQPPAPLPAWLAAAALACQRAAPRAVQTAAVPPAMSAAQLTVAAFVQSLYDMVSSEPLGLISWTQDGRSFAIRDTKALADKVLPTYFAHNNFASFARQLSFYAFSKLSAADSEAAGVLNRSRRTACYTHRFFVRGRRDTLSLVVRKTNKTANAIAEKIGGDRPPTPLAEGAQEETETPVPHQVGGVPMPPVPEAATGLPGAGPASVSQVSGVGGGVGGDFMLHDSLVGSAPGVPVAGLGKGHRGGRGGRFEVSGTPSGHSHTTSGPDVDPAGIPLTRTRRTTRSAPQDASARQEEHAIAETLASIGSHTPGGAGALPRSAASQPGSDGPPPPGRASQAGSGSAGPSSLPPSTSIDALQRQMQQLTAAVAQTHEMLAASAGNTTTAVPTPVPTPRALPHVSTVGDDTPPTGAGESSISAMEDAALRAAAATAAEAVARAANIPPSSSIVSSAVDQAMRVAGLMMGSR